MYTLRIIPKESDHADEINYLLGNSYRLFYSGTEGFKKAYSECFPGGLENIKDVTHFIEGDIAFSKSQYIHSIIKGYQYYIMADGNTVARFYTPTKEELESIK